MRALHTTLWNEGFTEIHAPVLVHGPALESTLEALRADGGWLHTSPEFSLKRVLAAGLPRIYAITPTFRAEEVGRHHGREFTMLEFYLCNAGYRDLIPIVERLVNAAAESVGAILQPFVTRTVANLFDGVIPADDDTYFRHWVDVIEPNLTAPTFVIDYPARHAALAEIRGGVAERVEFYIGGVELGNGFSELRNGIELRERFAHSAAERTANGRIPHPTDEGVIAATAVLPRCAGIAIGVDRLVMVLTGASDIGSVRVPR